MDIKMKNIERERMGPTAKGESWTKRKGEQGMRVRAVLPMEMSPGGFS